MSWLLSPWVVYPALWLFAAAVILWSIHVAGDDTDELTAEDYDVILPEGWAFCAEGHDGRCCVHSVRYQHKADAP